MPNSVISFEWNLALTQQFTGPECYWICENLEKVWQSECDPCRPDRGLFAFVFTICIPRLQAGKLPISTIRSCGNTTGIAQMTLIHSSKKPRWVERKSPCGAIAEWLTNWSRNYMSTSLLMVTVDGVCGNCVFRNPLETTIHLSGALACTWAWRFLHLFDAAKLVRQHAFGLDISTATNFTPPSKPWTQHQSQDCPIFIQIYKFMPAFCYRLYFAWDLLSI